MLKKNWDQETLEGKKLIVWQWRLAITMLNIDYQIIRLLITYYYIT